MPCAELSEDFQNELARNRRVRLDLPELFWVIEKLELRIAELDNEDIRRLIPQDQAENIRKAISSMILEIRAIARIRSGRIG